MEDRETLLSAVMAALRRFQTMDPAFRQFLGVRQLAAPSLYQGRPSVVTAAPEATNGNGGNGGSVSLLSNGGLNDAIGGATSGTLNLTQTAIGGNGGTRRCCAGFGGSGGNASSILFGTNPFGASSYNLNTFATGGNGGLRAAQVGSATAVLPQPLQSMLAALAHLPRQRAVVRRARQIFISPRFAGGGASASSTATNNGTGGPANANATASVVWVEMRTMSQVVVPGGSASADS